MKKNIFFLLFLFTLSTFAQTQDTIKYWKKGGLMSINFAQSSFTNWAAGGENAVSVTTLLNAFTNYKKEKDTWDNTLDLAYGMLQSGHSPLRKNEDKIDLSSKYGRYAFYEHWYYSGLLNFKSQFADGYNSPDDTVIISRFLAPAYIIGSIGLDYKPNEHFSAFISPLTSKTTVVNDQRLADSGAFGVGKAVYDLNGIKIKDGKLIRSEVGAYLRIAFKKDIVKNVNLATRLELFNNYFNIPQNIDVNWEILIGMKINKYLSANITTQLIYDHDIPVPVKRMVNGMEEAGTGPRLQFKEVLSIGFSYKF